MKKYDVIHSHMRLDLIAQVNAALAIGWELHGPMLASRLADGFDYLQPMVKELTELEVIAGRQTRQAENRQAE